MRQKIQRTCRLLLVIFLVWTFTTWAASRKWRVVQPAAAKKISVIVSGNESGYFVLEKNSPFELQVNGPAQLKVISRLNFQPGADESAEYGFDIKEGDKTIKSYSTRSEPSSAIYRGIVGVPGKSRKFTLQIPEGAHRYNFRLTGTSAQVLLRVLSRSGPAQSSSVSLTPVEYEKVVIAVLKEKPVSYYTCTSGKAVKIRVIGPTKLKVESRLNYETNMKGKQKYQLAVEENGKLISKQALEAVKSLTVTYQDLKTVVPGESRIFYLDVPDGQHTYSFKLGESIANSASLRFSIPKKDLKNEG